MRNWSDANDDVLIQTLPQGATVNDDYWKAATDKNIAWIVAHRNDGTAEADNPRMPQLEVGFPGGPSGINVKWKFKCWYDRGNDVRKSRNQTEDTITIDKTSSPTPANQMWKLHQEPQWSGDFFGGKCELTYQLVGSDGSSLTPETTVRFVIGGKNPDNAKAKAYIQAQTDAGSQGNLWFAYALAKHETAEYRLNGSHYNQFRSNTPLGYPTWNNDGASLPGGYGVFQVTGNASNSTANIPRKQIWNWQKNISEGGLVILRSKYADSVTAMNNRRAECRTENNGQDIPVPNHSVPRAAGDPGTMFGDPTDGAAPNPKHTFTDTGIIRAVAIKRNNGVAVIAPGSSTGTGDYCVWKNKVGATPGCWEFRRWRVLDGAVDQRSYVDLVMKEVE